MTKNEINPNLSNFKAVNAFIFAGSFSIGTLQAGFDLQKVLEISDQQLEQNAFYFKKNVSDVPVVLPEEWENDVYLDNLRNEQIDLMCCNCPCSSLSQINRNASIDGKNNIHFYRLFNIFKHVQPKTFAIENAPTLIKLGFPILKDMARQLGELYRFTIVRDCAGNHDVPMQRQRTFIIGWRRDVFSSIPLVNEDKQQKMTVKDAIGDLYSSTVDDCKSKTVDAISNFYKYAIPGYSLMTSLAKQYVEDKNGFAEMISMSLPENSFKEVKRIANKMQQGKNWWDKTPYKLEDDKHFPSFTSVTEYIHPHQDRMLNMKELGRIMNYPDWYDFTDQNKECKIPLAQAMAQGVPANFGKYIATQARLGLQNSLNKVDDSNIDIVFQNHSSHRYDSYTIEDFNNLNELDISKNAKKL